MLLHCISLLQNNTLPYFITCFAKNVIKPFQYKACAYPLDKNTKRRTKAVSSQMLDLLVAVKIHLPKII